MGVKIAVVAHSSLLGFVPDFTDDRKSGYQLSGYISVSLNTYRRILQNSTSRAGRAPACMKAACSTGILTVAAHGLEAHATLFTLSAAGPILGAVSLSGKLQARQAMGRHGHCGGSSGQRSERVGAPIDS